VTTNAAIPLSPDLETPKRKAQKAAMKKSVCESVPRVDRFVCKPRR
jgi:hypothetical protein